MSSDPFLLLNTWFQEAASLHLPQHDAMVLATATAGGAPSARMVLFKGIQDGQLRFFTNYESRKGKELLENPRAQLLFYWSGLDTGRQIRVEGTVEKLSKASSLAYFQSRARGSQVSAWASQQSRPLESREVLQKKILEIEKQFEGVNALPLPPEWGGYGLSPRLFEFWRDFPNRSHDRVVYEISKDGSWITSKLYP